MRKKDIHSWEDNMKGFVGRCCVLESAYMNFWINDSTVSEQLHTYPSPNLLSVDCFLGRGGVGRQFLRYWQWFEFPSFLLNTNCCFTIGIKYLNKIRYFSEDTDMFQKTKIVRFIHVFLNKQWFVKHNQ